jgi:hypothetical protein
MMNDSDNGGSFEVTMDSDARDAIANYLRGISRWRRARYNDDLRDARNLRAAAALDELADYVEMLPTDDPRLARLGAIAMDGALFAPGQQTSYEIGLFRFHNADTTFDGFLDRIVELAEADRREHGEFGGRQVEGDSPWRASLN